MARLKKHGYELFRSEKLEVITAYMSDGTVLYTYGNGWKVKGKIKPEGMPGLVKAARDDLDKLSSRVAYMAFREFMLARWNVAARRRIIAHIRDCQSSKATADAFGASDVKLLPDAERALVLWHAWQDEARQDQIKSLPRN